MTFLPSMMVLVIGLGVGNVVGEEGMTEEPKANYTERQDVREFIDQVVVEHDYDRLELERVFAETRYQQSVIDAITRPAEKRLSWWEYRNIFLKAPRISGGVQFWQDSHKILEKAVRQYQVAPEIMVAILGVETFYGTRTGNYRVIDALATLGFDYPPRSRFFRQELKQFLVLSKEEGKDPLGFKGSYAGAMGYGQFIPSSFRHFAVDFDQDGLRDIWHNVSDAVGSVGNYLQSHKWRSGEPVVYPVEVAENVAPNLERFVNQGIRHKGIARGTTVKEFKSLGVAGADKLPDDQRLALIRLDAKEGPKYWLADNNFFVITTYNTSRLYAMAVYDLSQAILTSYCASFSDSSQRKGRMKRKAPKKCLGR